MVMTHLTKTRRRLQWGALLSGALMLPVCAQDPADLGGNEEAGSASSLTINQAAAEIPGDGLTDLLLSLSLGSPVGRVTSLDPLAPPPSDVDPALPLAFYAIDFNRLGKAPDTERRVAESLRMPAVHNAYYALSLMSVAQSLGDAVLHREALRLGANAEVYDSPFTESVDLLLQRYQRLGPEHFGAVQPHLRGYEPMWDVAIQTTPRYSAWLDLCKEPTADAADDCAGLARLVLMEADTTLEATFAAAMLDFHERAQTGVETFKYRRGQHWIQLQAGPLLEQFEQWPPEQARAYIANLRSEGELAAMVRLLEDRGLTAEPPASWRSPAEQPEAYGD
jgi:hypothetical protein